MVVFAIAVGYSALTYAMFNPLRHYGKDHAAFTGLHVFVTAAFIYLGFALTMIRRKWRTHTLLRLAPGAGRTTAALTPRIALIALIAMPPAAVLRALMQVEFGPDLQSTVSLADVTLQSVGFSALYLLHVVVLVSLMCGPLKVPAQFASLPIMYGAMGWHGTFWLWLPLLVCVVTVGVTWFRRWLLEAEDGGSSLPQPFATWSRWHTPLLVGLLQRRAAKTTGAKAASARVVGLLASRSSVFGTVASVLALVIYMVITPGMSEMSGLKWLLVYMLSAFAVQLSPIPLSRIMLVPLGVERRRIGQIIAHVWARDLRVRIALGVSVGLLVHAFCWWIEWPAFLRSPFRAWGDVWIQLLWSPLAHAVGLYGIAMSACLLASASPKPLSNGSLGPLLPITFMVVFSVAGSALRWALNELIPETAAADVDHITFAIVNGALLPACAWCVHRSLRYQWATANLQAISSAMQTWSERMQKAYPAT